MSTARVLARTVVLICDVSINSSMPVALDLKTTDIGRTWFAEKAICTGVELYKATPPSHHDRRYVHWEQYGGVRA